MSDGQTECAVLAIEYFANAKRAARLAASACDAKDRAKYRRWAAARLRRAMHFHEAAAEEPTP